MITEKRNSYFNPILKKGYLKKILSKCYFCTTKIQGQGCMTEEVYLHYKFKNRKTGEFKDGYIKIPDVQKYANGLKRCFNIHEYRLCEKRLISKEEFDHKGKT